MILIRECHGQASKEQSPGKKSWVQVPVLEFISLVNIDCSLICKIRLAVFIAESGSKD